MFSWKFPSKFCNSITIKVKLSNPSSVSLKAVSVISKVQLSIALAVYALIWLTTKGGRFRTSNSNWNASECYPFEAITFTLLILLASVGGVPEMFDSLNETQEGIAPPFQLHVSSSSPETFQTSSETSASQ